MLQLAGLPAFEGAQGVSMAGALTGDGTIPELVAYGEALESHALFRFSRLRSISTGEWKYILAPQPLLFHVADDPLEQNDRAAAEPNIAAELRERLWNLLADAPSPLESGDAGGTMQLEDTEKLRSLGYVGGEAEEDQSGVTEIERFEPTGPDPRAENGTIALYTRARRDLTDGHMQAAAEKLKQVVVLAPAIALPAARPGVCVSTSEAHRRCSRHLSAGDRATADESANAADARDAVCGRQALR